MHIVMKSNAAHGRLSLLCRSREIERLVYRQGQIHGIKIIQYVNVGNHLHFLLRLEHRDSLKGFLRSLGGVIARFILDGFDFLAKQIQNFWSGRPFSRIVNGLRDFHSVNRYLFLNELETFGFDKLYGRTHIKQLEKFLQRQSTRI